LKLPYFQYNPKKGIEEPEGVMSESLSLSALVDLERYPLGDDAAFAPVVERCRAQLRESSFASLPGFLRSGVAESMTNEVLAAIPRAYRREQSFSAYDESTLKQYPPGHVRHRKHESRQYVVATDVLSEAGRLRTLYRNEILTQRIAQMLNEAALFQLADPVTACTSTVMYQGDTHGWHFDLNDFVVSILLQAPEAGGTFDFAPNIRKDGEENYAAVAAALDGSSQEVRSIRVAAGTLLLFCGRRALHRVPPVRGRVPRVIALFSYDRNPGVRYGSEVYIRVVGRAAAFEQ
jgi:hypothetical protein